MLAKSQRLSAVGQKYHAFTVIKSLEIPELQCLLRELVHEPTGARIMHIGNDDPENLFCLSFQTLPNNSNGVAHILEHTVLCGSQKYPVKDPFFSMNRRSLNTFMNALTGADFTCYPAATQVPTDFYNLLEVYLDAVFHPTLHELSFAQEGHRLEFAISNDPHSPLEYKGIVYNEMKGGLSSSSARLAEAINETLFPETTYGVNSGGDPAVIPTLTYQELKDFHKKYYHPSRCLFFFYGDLPLEGHLDFIAEHALINVERVSPLPPIPLQPRFSAPVKREFSYPISPEEETADKALLAFGWLTCHILEQEDVLAMNILEIILLDTDASPLKMALLRSGLCKQVNSFIDVEINEIPWGIILKGCNPNDADALEKIVHDTLNEICLKSLPTQMIENAIHQLEFHRSEITGDHAPFGLSLFMRSGLLKQHGTEPEQGLMIHSLFDRLRQRNLSDPSYFNKLIKKYLLDNSHYVRIVMKPDKTLGAKEGEEERRKLRLIKEMLTEEEIKAIIQKAEMLASFQKQQEEEDIEFLPKVTLKDVPLTGREYPLTKEKAGPLTLYHHAAFTNDIIYADLVYNLPDLTEEELFYLRLLTVVLTQVGCGSRSYEENLAYIQGHTGGIGAGISLNLQASDNTLFYPTFHLRGKALHRKASKLFPLMLDTLTATHLDGLKRFKEILFKHFSGMEGRLSQSALKYAINLSASALNPASKVANDLYGLNYYWKVRDLVKNFETQGPIVLAKLQAMREKVTCLDQPDLVLSCDALSYEELKRESFYGLQDIPAHPFTPWKGDFTLASIPPQGRLIASPVAFIGKVFSTVSYTHPYAPALTAAAFLFDNLTLHATIREQGGAYGGGAVSNPMSGNFYFYSYRDPNVVQTLKAFEEAIETIIEGDFDNSDLEEAKLEMIQSLDVPVSPGSQAELAYGWLREGKVGLRQPFRNQLLKLEREQIIEAVQNVIVPQFEKGAVIVFAGQEQLDKANKELASEGKAPLHIEGI
ncbi:MAG: insulinase family protein [Candidatus Protochlamydia sp.]|nr:insulinase family protein [Candidatus Protochlamydia sp.]